MRQFWRVSLYSGLAVLVTSAALFGSAEVVRGEAREEEGRFETEAEALVRSGAPFEEQAAARDEHEAAMKSKRRFHGRLEIGGLVALMTGLALTAAGAVAPGTKRTTTRPGAPFAGREDEGW